MGILGKFTYAPLQSMDRLMMADRERGAVV